MNIAEALDHAIASHAKWKYRLMEAIDTGKSEWHVGDVRGDNGCDFGKWLIALPLSERLSEHSKKVRLLHAEFHGLAADVLELALAGRKAEATAAMALRSRFAEVSSNLTMAVLAWKEAASGAHEPQGS
jgi:Chemoreceptor zinc-binding domain